MTTEPLDRAVLEALGARPDDDALRGVVADALLEAGDARGEFISLVRRQPLPATARKRAAKLFARHRAAWLGPVADVALTGGLGGRSTPRMAPQPFDGPDDEHPELWDRGFPVRLQATLSGTTCSAPAWLTVREVVLFPAPRLPLELEPSTTPNLRAVHVLAQRWRQARDEGYADEVRAFLRTVGREQALVATSEWHLRAVLFRGTTFVLG